MTDLAKLLMLKINEGNLNVHFENGFEPFGGFSYREKLTTISIFKLLDYAILSYIRFLKGEDQREIRRQTFTNSLP
jgi:hypothetical protein